MAVEVRVPAVGESVQEGIIHKWNFKSGDYVNRDDVLLELETDKATVEVVAEASGTLDILKKAGETVHVGDIIARLDTAAQPKAAPPAVATKEPVPSAETKAARGQAELAREALAQEGTKTPGAGQPSLDEDRVLPAARRMIEEHRLPVEAITGSGKGGRITKGDVVDYMENATKDGAAKAPILPKPPTPQLQVVKPAAQGRGERREPMTLLRRRIAERLVQAQAQAAILTTFNEVDMSAVMTLRNQYKEDFKKRYGISLGFMGFFVKAAIAALREYPRINGWIEGQEVVYHDYYDIGVAVSTERGLVVPVLRDANEMSFAEVELAIAAYAKKAREGKITVDELSGGTFTISNGGVFGSLLSTPILNPPQSGILGMHKIQERPVAVDGQVVVRPMMYLALSYDHRIVDGREAVQFLVKVKECVEDPSRLLLGV